MLSNDLRTAHHIDADDPQWLFPPERAPQPPCNKGCKHNGFVDPALPSPSPPISMSRCILSLQLTADVVKIAMTSTLQTTFSLEPFRSGFPLPRTTQPRSATSMA